MVANVEIRNEPKDALVQLFFHFLCRDFHWVHLYIHSRYNRRDRENNWRDQESLARSQFTGECLTAKTR